MKFNSEEENTLIKILHTNDKSKLFLDKNKKNGKKGLCSRGKIFSIINVDKGNVFQQAVRRKRAAEKYS